MNVHSKSYRKRLLAGTTEPPARDLGDKRDRILTAALELFAKKGFHGTTVPEIAERARVGAGTLYRYFKNKEALVNELFRHWKGLLFTSILGNFPFDGTPREQFHAIFTRLAEFGQTHPQALDFLELHHHAEYLDSRSREVEQNLLAALRGIVVPAQKKHVLKSIEPEILGALVWGGFLGLVTANRKGLLPMTPKVLEAAEECLWEAVRR
jgi:AcrR family transcriptional regulator